MARFSRMHSAVFSAAGPARHPPTRTGPTAHTLAPADVIPFSPLAQHHMCVGDAAAAHGLQRVEYILLRLKSNVANDVDPASPGIAICRRQSPLQLPAPAPGTSPARPHSIFRPPPRTPRALGWSKATPRHVRVEDASTAYPSPAYIDLKRTPTPPIATPTAASRCMPPYPRPDANPTPRKQDAVACRIQPESTSGV
ncbi:hypothetical protein EVG20_g4412 [Dentipellis fragilis]|uniref:Uncharacterized protein n=1 Tax=Dentipellis fragilis TaxID=205917 RepID=A0A4Y9YWJ3_9AGAM|nr:hypothetical protein EVG20_g4412 [Dentipellis fragilis]